MGVAGVVLLVWRMKLADMFIAVTAPVGMAITGVALVTGAIWGRPDLGCLVGLGCADDVRCWCSSFCMSGSWRCGRPFRRAQQAGRAAAILAIVGTVNVPIIKYSVGLVADPAPAGQHHLHGGPGNAALDVGAVCW